MKRAFLYDHEINSGMKELSQIKPTGRSFKSITATLILTSLVDVFSILVIYLLVTSSNRPHELEIDGMELPAAQESSVIDSGSVVKVRPEGVFIHDQLIPENQLDGYLQQMAESLREKEGEDAKLALVIQADKSLDYSLVDPIILKATALGFSRLRFAVVHEGT